MKRLLVISLLTAIAVLALFRAAWPEPVVENNYRSIRLFYYRGVVKLGRIPGCKISADHGGPVKIDSEQTP